MNIIIKDNISRITQYSYLKNEVKIKNLKKMKELEYHSLKPMPYLTSTMFTQKKASLLLALRTRTIWGIRSDFGKMYTNQTCPLEGCTHLDTLASLLTCLVLRSQSRQLLNNNDLERQRAVVEVFDRLLEVREDMLTPPVA